MSAKILLILHMVWLKKASMNFSEVYFKIHNNSIKSITHVYDNMAVPLCAFFQINML